MLQAIPTNDYIGRLNGQFPLLERFEANPISATIEYYATCLAGNDKAIQCIQQVLSLSLEQARSLNIGFSDRSLGGQLPSNQVQHGRMIRDQLVSLGIYKTNGRETLRGYVTIPLFNEHGDVTGIHALRVGARHRHDEPIVIGAGELPCGIAPIATAEMQAVAANSLPSEILSTTEVNTQQVPSNDEVLTNDTTSTAIDSGSANSIATDKVAVVPIVATAVATPAFDLIVTPHQVTFIRGDRHYKVQGLERNMSSLTLRVSLQASRLDLIHLDTLDLVKARSRTSFIQAAAVELFVDENVVKKDIGLLLLQLEDLRNRQIEASKSQATVTHVLSDAEQEQALDWLRDPNLTGRIVSDLDQCGMVGESFNKLAAYLAVISRKLAQPLAILIQSSSSAGKTTLMDSVLGMVPPEDQLRLSNLTGQSLYYLDSHAIRHKTLAISEEQGIAEASYALKLLQSEGRLSHATVAKGLDGRMAMRAYHVEGPVQLFLTSTSLELDEELVNRCLVLTVDESREQTMAIQAQQRLLQTRHGQALSRQCQQVRQLHHNAQRLLRPLKVYNPYADRLSFASDRTRLRRDHSKYLTLIQSIALLHQYQRPIQIDEVDGKSIESIEVTLPDIALANRLMAEILGRSLDELSPQTRRCLLLLEQFVAENCKRTAIDRENYRFSRREFREWIGWSDFQVRMHLDKLVAMEYVLVHHGKQGRSYVYELIYAGQGQDGRPFVMGLCELATCTSSI